MKRGSTSKSHWDKIEKDRMKTIVSIIVLFALCTILRADEALHHIELKSCAILRSSRRWESSAFFQSAKESTPVGSISNAGALAAANPDKRGAQDVSGRLLMSCASCHLGKENEGRPGLPVRGVTSFADFSARCKIPEREDGRCTCRLARVRSSIRNCNIC